MRLLLFTGRGGAGTTTMAAATAVHAATCGIGTVLCSLDPHAHLGQEHLAEVLGATGPSSVDEPVRNLRVHRLNRPWESDRPGERGRERLARVLQDLDLDPVPVRELAELPGVDQMATLIGLADLIDSFDAPAPAGAQDGADAQDRADGAGGDRAGGTGRTGGDRPELLVLDCPSFAATLRLLALPEDLASCLGQLLPVDRRIERALSRSQGASPSQERGDRTHPCDHVAEAADDVCARLSRVRDVLTGPGACVRLVVPCEPRAVRRAREARTALCLLGHAVDAVVVNRVLPAEWFPSGDGRELLEAQQTLLDAVRADFAPLPVLPARHSPVEPVGVRALAALGEELHGPAGPCSGSDLLTEPDVPRFRVERRQEEYLVVLPLPHVARERVRLSRRGDDLVMEVPGRRRVLSLPSALRRCQVTTAALRDGELTVRFRPDPALWPTA